MSLEQAAGRDDPKRPPRLGPYVAVVLEISMVGVFAYHHSVAGLLLAAGYAWFSATWAMFTGYFSEPEL
jgi:hypothetical protein